MTGGTIVYGGSFDPIHRGHLRIAKLALLLPEWRRVVFVPAGQNPLKTHSPVAGERDRFEMVSRAIAEESGFSVSDIELGRGGVSFTYETVQAFRESGETSLALLVGDDLVDQLDRWHRSEELLRGVHVIVATRGGFDGDRLKERSFPMGYTLLKNDALTVSSSGVREAARADTAIDHLVPEVVAAYIAERGIYA